MQQQQTEAQYLSPSSSAIDCFRQLGLLITGGYVGNYEDVLLFENGITAEFNLISGYSQNCDQRLLASSCVSVRLNNSAPTGRIFMKFNIYFSQVCREYSGFTKIAQH